MITLDLFDTLQDAWTMLCADYDVTTALPDIDDLFDGVDPSAPAEAAQTVMINLLGEIMESVSRFSPWYKRPASAFGITLNPDPCKWTLTDQAHRSRQGLLRALEDAIAHNKSVILATRFLGGIEQVMPCRAYTCQCIPPRTILVQQSARITSPIICDTCQQPFL